MGWKGTVRSLQTAANQAQREGQRRAREQQRRQAQLAKMAELERAAAEVAIYEDFIASLTTVHGTEVVEVDWNAIAGSSEPPIPSRSDTHERAARKALDEFKPKLLESKKRQTARRQELEESIPIAISKDEANHKAALAEHAEVVEEWSASKQLAHGVLAGDVGALAEAARQIEELGAGSEYLRHVDIEINGGRAPSVTVALRPAEEVVPKEQRSLLASGKLSVKQMPKGQFNELYQDYLCGSALMVANAVLGMLPVRSLTVNATVEMLNTATGHIEETLILSIYAPRETIGRLNLGMVDASDAMTNFAHNMKFLKTKGFQPVDPVAVPDSA